MDLQTFLKAKMDRRKLLGSASLVGAGVVLGGYGSRAYAQELNPELDAKILNFALNLEYLEAEYYLRGVFGRGLSDEDIGPDAGEVVGGRQVEFETEAIREYAEEIALDEEAHVRFLRAALGDAAVSRPKINFTDAFNTAAQAAGLVDEGVEVDHFKNELFFLLGAFLFEDVGVSAYKGAARFISNKSFLAAASSILGTESYHAGEIRTLLYDRRNVTPGTNQTVQELAQKISDARDLLDGEGDTDQGIVHDNPFGTQANVVLSDENALAYSRTPFQVLNIVYLDLNRQATPGGFFPNGVNGDFSGVPSL